MIFATVSTAFGAAAGSHAQVVDAAQEHDGRDRDELAGRNAPGADPDGNSPTMRVDDSAGKK